jgi:hypothetical protein
MTGILVYMAARTTPQQAYVSAPGNPDVRSGSNVYILRVNEAGACRRDDHRKQAPYGTHTLVLPYVPCRWPLFHPTSTSYHYVPLCQKFNCLSCHKLASHIDTHLVSLPTLVRDITLYDLPGLSVGTACFCLLAFSS